MGSNSLARSKFCKIFIIKINYTKLLSYGFEYLAIFQCVLQLILTRYLKVKNRCLACYKFLMSFSTAISLLAYSFLRTHHSFLYFKNVLWLNVWDILKIGLYRTRLVTAWWQWLTTLPIITSGQMALLNAFIIYDGCDYQSEIYSCLGMVGYVYIFLSTSQNSKYIFTLNLILNCRLFKNCLFLVALYNVWTVLLLLLLKLRRWKNEALHAWQYKKCFI